MQVITREEAKARGLSRYYTGKTCANGHCVERRTCDGKCVGCHDARKARYETKLRSAAKDQRHDSGKFFFREAKSLGLPVYTGKPCSHNHPPLRRTSTGECVVCYETRIAKWQAGLDELAEKKANGFLNYAERKSKAREDKRRWLEMTERRCPRCDEMKTENDFRWVVTTKRADICIECRGKVAEHENAKKSGKYKARMAERELAERRQKPKWADGKMIRKVYAYARELRDSGFNCHVDHIIPLRGEMVSGLHVHWNLRVIKANQNVMKSNALPEDAHLIPAEWQNPGFKDFAGIDL